MTQKTFDLTEKSIAALEDEIRDHNRRYWDDAAPTISDYAFDRLVEELRRRAPTSPVLDDLGSKPGQELGSRVEHPVAMLSLDKCYDDETLLKWTQDFTGGVVAVPKFDGIACALRYGEDGRLLVAATRGDGSVGDDITANVLGIKGVPRRIPEGPREIRGEIYMKLSVFQAFKEAGMANPRNLAAGAIKQKDAKKSADYKLSFAAYDLLGSAATTQVEVFEKLAAFGFDDFEFTVLEKEAAPLGYQQFAAQRSALDFEIDGVVYKANDLGEQRRLGSTAHHPRGAIAYKFQGDSGTTTLNAVEWSVARTGAITPVAIVAPVSLSGVTVERASLHNAGYIAKLNIGVGAEVVLTGAAASSRTSNSCHGAVVAVKDFLYCAAPQNCPAALRGQLAHFASTTEMLGFGDVILEQCFQRGLLRRPSDFYRLTAKDLEGLERSGKKLAAKLVSEVDKTRTQKLATFLRALGIDELGKSVSGLLEGRYRTLDAVLEASEEELGGMQGIGPVIAKSVTVGLAAAREEIDLLRAFVTFEAPVEEGGGVAGPLTGASFVLTGKLNAYSRGEAETQVKKLGASVLSGVSAKLTYLVCGEEKDGKKSSKQKAAEKAIEGGAPLKILDEAGFLALLPNG
ncbi:hypothetical protein OUZ56_032504 [Daphnia magna]|uniref:DNA ligase (NAD(+)) n=1 Tax=Daphnia magna TaxID=35525 RepID=A0ABR0B939_9CRUS|nr:hypothetical protein OUZ56_032504 [Daphnia magna]